MAQVAGKEVLDQTIGQALASPRVVVECGSYAAASRVRWALYRARDRNPEGKALEIRVEHGNVILQRKAPPLPIKVHVQPPGPQGGPE